MATEETADKSQENGRRNRMDTPNEWILLEAKDEADENTHKHPMEEYSFYQAVADGDMDTVFAIQKKHQDAQRKSIESELTKKMPTPPSGNNVKVDYSQQIAEAQASGNMAMVASLLRQQSMANAKQQ